VVNGTQTFSTPGQVIEGKDFHGCVLVRAANVTIRNSRITCTPGYAVESGDNTGSSLIIQDSEISCNDGPGTALGEANITARRLNIHGCENGGDLNQNIDIRDSYIHDMYNTASNHMDGIQLSGHWANGWVSGSLNITLVHNRILGLGADGSQGTSAIISNPGGVDTNVLIQNNFLDGGAYSLYCDRNGTATNYRVIDNDFGRRAAYGPWTSCADEQISGNVWADTRQPLPPG
jgi:hypothetical protein